MPFDEGAFHRVRCTADTPVIRMSVGEQRSIDVIIHDEQGNPIDMTQFAEPFPNNVFTRQICETRLSSSSTCNLQSLSSSQVDWKLESKLSASNTLGSPNNNFIITGVITDAANGAVRFEFTPTTTQKVGLMVASVGVFWRGILRYQQMLYLEFMPNNFTLGVTSVLTVPEVRMDLMDMCPDANYLIDELEFTDAEIIHAMRKAVDMFNEAQPPIGGYTYAAFPFRANWLKGSVAYLLQMIANRYRRNWLKYQAGGVTVGDQERFREYEATGKQLEVEYLEWVERKKVSINITMGYRSVGPSPYGRGRQRRGYF